MGLSLEGLAPAHDPRRGCVIGKRLLPLLSDKDKAKFYEMLADPKWSDKGLADALNARIQLLDDGDRFVIKGAHLSDHRQENCHCKAVGLA